MLRVRQLTACLLLAFAGAVPCAAAEAAETDQPAASITTPAPGDFILMRGPDGRLVPVPANADLARFLEWQNKSKPEPAAEAPEFSIGAVSLEGRADDDRAELTATLSVKVQQSGWVRVPLRLDEAVIRSGEHHFEGQDGTAGFADFDRMRGYRWWFRGEGVHELKLTLLVPIRRQAGSRRLQLSLPDSAASGLTLRIAVPSNRLNIPAEPEQLVTARVDGPGGTKIEAVGLDENLDLNWQVLPNPRQVRTVLQVESELRVEPSEEAVLLRARQLVEALQGSFTSVQVSLPPGFEISVLKVNGEKYQAEPASVDGAVVVKLAEGTVGPLQLDWVLLAPLPADRRFEVSGLQVEGALRQTGEISVVGYGGYRVVKHAVEDVHRTNVQPSADGSEVVSAYRFWKQPFRLELELQPVDAVFSVRPTLLLDVGTDHARMQADFEIEVFRGVVRELALDWPQFQKQAWQVNTQELPVEIETFAVDPQTGHVSLTLAKVLEEGSRFRLPVSAVRPITPGQAVPLTLPRFDSQHQARPVLVLVQRDQVEARLTPADGTLVQPMPALPKAAAEPDILGLDPLQHRHEFFLIRSNATAFQLEVIEHARRLQADSLLTVDVTPDEIRVSQSTQFRVEYARQSELRLVTSTVLPLERLELALNGQPVTAVWEEPPGTGQRIGRLVFAPQIDTFTLTAHYFLPPAQWSSESTTTLGVPCVEFEGVDDVNFRLEIQSQPPAEVRLRELDWLNAAEGAANTWVGEAIPSVVACDLSRGAYRVPVAFQVPRGLIRSQLGRDGRVQSQAQFRIVGPVETFSLTFEKPIQLGQLWWNATPIAASSLSELPDGGVVAEVTVPEPLRNADPAAVAVFGIDYQSETHNGTDWNEPARLPAPQWASNVWVGQVLWEVRLPGDQRLFTEPSGYSPAFEWSRQGIFWRRQTQPEFADLQAWIGTESPKNALAKNGNAYVFTRYGNAASLQFHVMSQSLVVLFGAGLALALGFTFVKIRRFRSVLSVLTLFAIVAAVALWFPGPVSLLLQPAILGCLLAGVAIVFDGWLRRKRRSAVLTLQSASGYSPGSGPVLPRGMIAVGSEDPTAVRALPLPQRIGDAGAHSGRRPASSNDSPAEGNLVEPVGSTRSHDAM